MTAAAAIPANNSFCFIIRIMIKNKNLMIKYYGCYRYLHFYSDVYVLPFVYGRLESAISFDRLWQGQIFKEDVAALKRVSAGSPVHLWSHIICVVPFAAIGKDGIYCQCMYGRLRRAVPECGALPVMVFPSEDMLTSNGIVTRSSVNTFGPKPGSIPRTLK